MEPREEALAALQELGISLTEGIGETLSRLRDEQGLLEQLARIDVIFYLRRWFTEERRGWEARQVLSGPGETSPVAVEWEYDGLHDGEGFNGVRATGLPVTVRGITMILAGRSETHDREELRFKRYADWAGIYAQLGLTMNWRIPLDNVVD